MNVSRALSLLVLLPLVSLVSGGCAGPAADPTPPPTTAAATEPAEFYTCPMHTSVRSPTPGKCPICGMELVLVREDETPGAVRIDDARRQEIGVRLEPATRRAMTRTLRAVGRVVVDETRLADVSVKVGGWIGDLRVDETGQRVRRGQVLFTLYSPELYAAQGEYLAALASQRAAAGTTAPGRADYLVRAARERLRLWDLRPEQIDAVAASGQPLEQLPIVAPVSGFVVEKDVVAGGAVSPGMRLFRLAGLDTVWVEAEIYEADVPLVQPGDAATVTFPYLPGKRFEGRVSFVFPYLDATTRSGRARVVLANADLALRPDMYADVELEEAHGERLTVPESAVLEAGDRRFVFVDLGDGRLAPRQVVTGLRAGGAVEVLDGIAEGDPVVVSGNFLIAAESRLALALERWGDAPSPGAGAERPPAADSHRH